MNVNFVGSVLYKGFNLVAGMVPSYAMKQVLKGVRVEVKNGQVELTATDLEVLVKYMLSVKECLGEGSVVLPAARVNNILREWAGNEEVIMLMEKNNCILKSKGGYFRIVGEASEQFPEIDVTDSKSFVEVDGEIVSNMAGMIIHAVSTVKARSTLCGVFVAVDGDDITMVATDGNRLSRVRRKVINTSGVSMKGIVTVKCLTFLQRFVSECRGVLRVGMSESRVWFVGEMGKVVSQLIDGQYPKYEDVIPKQNDKRVEVNRNDLLSAVRMASFMTEEGYRVVRFVFKQSKLVLLSRAADVGETELELAISYDGPNLEVSFNPDYVLDALKAASNDMIAIELGGENSVVLLRTGHEQLSVIMPIEQKQD